MQNNAFVFLNRKMLGVFTLSALLASASSAYAVNQPPAPPVAAPAAAPALLELPAASTPAAPAPLPVLPPIAEKLPASTPSKAIVPTPPAQAGSALTVQTPMTLQVPLPALPDKPMTEQKAPPYIPKLYTIDPQTKQQVLEEPVDIAPDFSLMFSEKDMVNVVQPSLQLFDKSGRAIASPQGGKAGQGDDLTGLLESLKISGSAKNVVVQQIPNLYLGSILYYAPNNWSVWINGKKIVNRLNNSTNVLYVSSISPSEVQLVWKPSLFKDMVKTWNEKNAIPGFHPSHIEVDEAKNRVILTLHPNQTFVPKAMVIREGLVIQEAAPAPAAAPASEPGAPAKTELPAAMSITPVSGIKGKQQP